MDWTESDAILKERARQTLDEAFQEFSENHIWRGIALSREAINLVDECQSSELGDRVEVRNEVATRFLEVNLVEKVAELDDEIEACLEYLSDSDERAQYEEEVIARRAHCEGAVIGVVQSRDVQQETYRSASASAPTDSPVSWISDGHRFQPDPAQGVPSQPPALVSERTQIILPRSETAFHPTALAATHPKETEGLSNIGRDPSLQSNSERCEGFEKFKVLRRIHHS